MNDLQVFNNADFGSVRTLEIDGKPYFVANDVARALGYSVPKDAISRHCKGALKHRYLTEGGEQELKIIPEGDVYRLVIKSQLPKADEFEHWIFDEVLPSIRKNGGYIANQENLTPEQIVANALIVAQNIISQKDRQIEQMKPKAEFFDAVADSKTAISMNEVSKVLGIKGYGRNNLFEFLRSSGILDRWNVPYQRYIDCGWFRVIEQKYSKNGEQCVSTKTLVYQKGVDAIRKKILDSEKTA
jgi:prophage antirepressor-like protein|nr:MAG TPA: repressor domain protein [Caudoviricetes sp.]DAZ75473.1 MAG TPA: repressor domain protein [Caudoviricetes sp.]